MDTSKAGQVAAKLMERLGDVHPDAEIEEVMVGVQFKVESEDNEEIISRISTQYSSSSPLVQRGFVEMIRQHQLGETLGVE